MTRANDKNNPLLHPGTKPSRGPRRSRRDDNNAPAAPRHGLWRRIFNAVWFGVNILVALALLTSAVSGTLSPQQHPHAVIAAMAFPAALLAVVAVFVADLIWWRRTAVVAGGAMLMCSGSITEYCPLNFPKRALTEEQKARSFTLMSYNAMAFLLQPGVECEVNPQISYILEQNPDVVCVQEYMLMMKNPNTRIVQAQVDSLYRRYPYVMTSSYLQIIFSKYPVEPIPIDFENYEGKGDMGAWRLHIHDRVVNVFSVHLRSLFFTTHDKATYKKIFNPEDINRRNLSEVKSTIFSKIVDASKARALQVDSLQRYVKKYGGANTIVCGDFNEPTGCRSLYTLEHDSHMRQVYPEVGFGPMITYNANRFWVRIDHVLYRGDLVPHSMHRGDLRASDHYPLTTTFCFKDGT